MPKATKVPTATTPALAYRSAVNAAAELAAALAAVPDDERSRWALYTLEMLEEDGGLTAVELAQVHESLGQRLEDGSW